MTHKDSICIRCNWLATSRALVLGKGSDTYSLVAECIYGGKNAGNRKVCKRFREASENVINDRLSLFERVDGGADNG